MNGLHILTTVKYTAVITSFNSENTIGKALTSILQQEITPQEIIMVDDHSSDQTVTIAKSFIEQFPNLQIIVNAQNSGQSFGRNIAADSAKTDYLVFFDSDDFSLPSRSKLHIDHFNAGSDISFVSSQKEYHPSYKNTFINSEKTCKPSMHEMSKLLFLGGKVINLENTYIPASTCAVTLSSFNSVGRFDEKMRRLEDVDLAMKYAINNLQFSWSQEIGVLRGNTENFTKGNGLDMIYEHKLISKYQEYLESKDFRFANKHVTSRRLYFSKQFFRLFLHFFLNPTYCLKLLLRFDRLISRLKHDFRK
jgi:glycosyltransferase involved in cell wall biosynthesis